MFSTFPSNYLGEQKNFFLFARNLINTMDMINTTPTESNLSGLNQKDFQKDINNKKTDLFILKNAQGMEVAVTNYGCAILSIMVPDENGKYANVVLGHDSIEHVINSPEPFLNTTIGRFRLNHRVRDVDGCFPKAYRHQKTASRALALHALEVSSKLPFVINFH